MLGGATELSTWPFPSRKYPPWVAVASIAGGGKGGVDKDISWTSGVDAALGCMSTMTWSFDVCREVMRSIFPRNISSGMVFGMDTGDLSDLRVLAVLKFDVFLETSGLSCVSMYFYGFWA